VSVVPIRADHDRDRPLGRQRVVRLRVGHVVLPLIWFSAHELSRGVSGPRLLTALASAGVWYLSIRSTLLRQSRAAPSWSLMLVRSFEGAVVAAMVILAGESLLGSGDSAGTEVGATAAMWMITVLWQAAVAGHHTLGEPLRVAVVGSDEMVLALERERVAPGAHPFDLVGWIDDGTSHASETPRARRLGAVAEIEEIVVGGGIDLLVVGLHAGRPALYARLLDLGHIDFSVIEYGAFFERTFGRVPIEELTATWFLHTMHLHRRDEWGLTRRMFDVVAALIGVALASPVLVIAALAIRLRGGPGPILYRQVRTGEGGKAFTMVKFRTMRSDIASSGGIWTEANDTRITPAGRLLRKTHFDELPQLLNILRGEMTFVGPRPEAADIRWLADEIPFYKPRHFARPGITGWAQVCSGYASSLDETRRKLSYDLYYLRYRSPSLDLAIILRTVAMLVGSFVRRPPRENML
jgi:lipopolysaccharide/colanic/teichoic acid biosynthesis glycosyltransferase